MNLEILWDKKELLRDKWRNNREDKVIQIRFGKACEEWEQAFTKLLKANGIEIYKYQSFATVYKDTEKNQILTKQELINRLSSFMDKELVNKISFDLH